jgi:PAN domain
MKTLPSVERQRLLSLGRITIAGTLISGGILILALTTFSWSAFAVDGTNLPGRDYDHFDAPSAFVCRNSCGGDPRCQAYTWVKPGFQGPRGQCWLKSSEPKIVKDVCCDSGPRRFISARDLKAEDKINRPGLDFKNFNTDSWKQCEAACAQNEICSSWSYVRPGAQGPTGRCWLKNRVARPVADANVISGVKFRPASVPFD